MRIKLAFVELEINNEDFKAIERQHKKTKSSLPIDKYVYSYIETLWKNTIIRNAYTMLLGFFIGTFIFIGGIILLFLSCFILYKDLQNSLFKVCVIYFIIFVVSIILIYSGLAKLKNPDMDLIDLLNKSKNKSNERN